MSCMTMARIEQTEDERETEHIAKERALKEMKQFGFNQELVLRVLNSLLKTYEGSWTHIEADNYEVLVTELLDCSMKLENVQPNECSVNGQGIENEEERPENLESTQQRKRGFEGGQDTTLKKPHMSGECGNGKNAAKRELEPRVSRSLKIEGKDARDKGTATGIGHAEAIRNTGSSSNGLAALSSIAKNCESPHRNAANGTLLHKSNRAETTLLAMYEGNAKWMKKPRHDPTDISKGAEAVRIPFVNEYNDETIPDDFTYTGKSIIYQKASVGICLARIGDTDCCRTCFGNCLKKKYPCSCSHETGGEFAYTEDGCLKESFLQVAMKETSGAPDCQRVFCEVICPMEVVKNPDFPDKCKGHIVRKFVNECWSKCTCHRRDCGNRVVQHGVKYRLQVFWTPDGKGWGVRSTVDLPLGAFICEFAGEVLTNTELDERNKDRKWRNGRHTYPMILDADVCSERILDDDTLLCLDATNFGNVARFINHRCGDANMVDVPVQIETPDRHYYHVAFFTTRPVKAFEELTWDYKDDFEEANHPVKPFKCKCGSDYCRNPER